MQEDSRCCKKSKNSCLKLFEVDKEDKAFVNPVEGSLSSKICKDIGD